MEKKTPLVWKKKESNNGKKSNKFYACGNLVWKTTPRRHSFFERFFVFGRLTNEKKIVRAKWQRKRKQMKIMTQIQWTWKRKTPKTTEIKGLYWIPKYTLFYPCIYDGRMNKKRRKKSCYSLFKLNEQWIVKHGSARSRSIVTILMRFLFFPSWYRTLVSFSQWQKTESNVFRSCFAILDVFDRNMTKPSNTQNEKTHFSFSTFIFSRCALSETLICGMYFILVIPFIRFFFLFTFLTTWKDICKAKETIVTKVIP